MNTDILDMIEYSQKMLLYYQVKYLEYKKYGVDENIINKIVDMIDREIEHQSHLQDKK